MLIVRLIVLWIVKVLSLGGGFVVKYLEFMKFGCEFYDGLEIIIKVYYFICCYFIGNFLSLCFGMVV